MERTGDEGRYAVTDSSRWNGRLSHNHTRYDVFHVEMS